MIDNLLKKLSTDKRKLKDLSDEEQVEIVEMLDYYRSGKRIFWVVIALGMLATASTAVIIFFRHISSFFK